MTNRFKYWVIAFIAMSVVGASGLVHAQTDSALPLVSNAFVRLQRNANAHSTAVYMTVTNMTNVADRLVGARSPLAERVEIHAIMHNNGMRRMHEVDEILLPTDRPMILAPGGYHLMLIGLKQPLVTDIEVPLELRFATAGLVSVIARTVEFKSSQHTE